MNSGDKIKGEKGAGRGLKVLCSFTLLPTRQSRIQMKGIKCIHEAGSCSNTRCLHNLKNITIAFSKKKKSLETWLSL